MNEPIMETDSETMNFMTTERAVDFVAAQLLASLLEVYGGDAWEECPDIGEDDWISVLERAKEIAHGPGRDAFFAAYQHLKARSVAWEQANR